MSDEHTPGPWEIDGTGCVLRTKTGVNERGGMSGGFGIAQFFGEHTPSEADARLMTAAPELLASLVEIRDMLWSRPDIVAKLRPLMGFAEQAISERAAAAIAKAKGP